MTVNKKEQKTPILDLAVKSFCKVDDCTTKLNNRVNKANWKLIALIVLGLYVIAHIVISIFHEPWYDEAVAWQIAKYASLKDILFLRPHYEGHPPLWHLILLPFAKLGCPYELSLSVVSLLFSGGAVALILFKSPFPKPVRLILPFTYFFFYQYGVISRPYCVMMLAFMLSAITYKNKDKKPFAFVLSLILLCLSSAYGIIIAGGIAIAWLIEIFRNEKFIGIFKNKKRLIALLVLLVCALLLIAEILPAEDACAANNLSQGPHHNNTLVKLIYTIFVLPADVTITNIFNVDTSLSNMPFEWYNLMSGCIAGIILWIAALYYAKKKHTIPILIIPYLLFAGFSAIKYMYIHHIGIGLLFFIFWIWLSLDSHTDNAVKSSELKEKITGGILKTGFAIFLIVSLYWSIAASVGEICCIYSTGRNEANFIKENNLTDYKIYACYTEYYAYDYDAEEYDTSELLYSDINHCYDSDNILAYFDENIFYNFNNGDDNIPYTTHKIKLSTENTELLQGWKSGGLPDVIIGFSSFSEIFGEEVKSEDYALVFVQQNRKRWKDTYTDATSGIFVRKELAKELGLRDDINFMEYFLVVR